MNRERLEEVEKNYEIVTDHLAYIGLDDLRYIIEYAKEKDRQIERVQKLVNKHVDWLRLEKQIWNLKRQNGNYREALEFYADKDNHREKATGKPLRGKGVLYFKSTIMEMDEGRKARKALKGDNDPNFSD